MSLDTEEIAEVRLERGIAVPAAVRFRQLIVTGPPGSGKSALVSKLGGWPEEGFLDLASDWWHDRMLTFRPREVHLGIPFVGHPTSQSVFDKAWLEAPTEVAVQSIRIPPSKQGFFSLDWRGRYVFDFQLLPPEEVYLICRARAREGTHPVDVGLTLAQVAAQVRAYETVALRLHRGGVEVIVRKSFQGPPRRIVDPKADFSAEGPEPDSKPPPSVGSWLTRVSRHLVKEPERVELGASSSTRLSRRGIELALSGRAYRIEVGAETLDLQPDLPMHEDRAASPPHDLLLLNEKRYYEGIGDFARITPGSKLQIDGHDERWGALLGGQMSRSHRGLEISHRGESVVLRGLATDANANAKVSFVDSRVADQFLERRRRALRRVVEIFGGPLRPLPAADALSLLAEVSRLQEREPNRPADSDGAPGAAVELSAAVIPVLVGDLHGKVDNLVTLLSHNGFIDSIERGSAALVILGDAVHSDDPDALEEMDGSVLLMDLIFKLKLRFPSGVFFLTGNHDSFSPSVTKRGTPQGLLWAKHLVELRSEEYRQQMELFYERCPLVAFSPRFCACHAGPPQSKVSMDMIVNARRSPHLVHELTWTRQRTPGYPGGYAGGDVRRFRKALGLGTGVPFVVGHYPRSDDASFWLDAGRVAGHHVVYSSRAEEVAVFTGIGERMVPQLYRTEPLVEWANREGNLSGK